MTRPTSILKTIFKRREATIFPGAANGLFARIIEAMKPFMSRGPASPTCTSACPISG